MKLEIEGLAVAWPYDYVYPEQVTYMAKLKLALDAGGHCLLEMPTGTGKTIALLALAIAFHRAFPEKSRKVIYCTRTVHEMDKVMAELKRLIEFRKREEPEEPAILAVCLSARRNLCVHEEVSGFDNRDKVDAMCRNLTASWVREKAANGEDIELCEYFEGYEENGTDAALTGILSLDDLKKIGRQKKWCPYFLARRSILLANVVVYNYQYLLDPKIAGMVSRELERNSIVITDEAHNLDSICIEAMSVSINKRTLEASASNLDKISGVIRNMETTDAARLNEEYRRLVEGLAQTGVLANAHGQQASSYNNHNGEQSVHRRFNGGEDVLANPLLPEDILREAVPGNIRRAKHFIVFMKTVVQYMKIRLRGKRFVQEVPRFFVRGFEQSANMATSQTKALRFCYDRLQSLLRTIQVSDLDEFTPLQLVADFATLVATYDAGFSIIMEPFNDRTPTVSDPVLRLCCLDASIAMKPVLQRFRNVIITSGTLSPIDFFPKLLGFTPMIAESLSMSLSRPCICPIVVSKGSDQLELTSKFDKRADPSVISNYGKLLLEFAKVVPDGIVCFFTSYAYMESTISAWHEYDILRKVLEHKLIFIETQDIVETSLALDSYKRACDCGRGAVFFSVARGKVAEGIDFDRHYGRCVMLFGIPFQYTLSRVLKARLEYLQSTHGIREGDFLTFDAMRQASQCMGRVIRSKTDYGLIVLADMRYRRADKRQKLPQWVLQYLESNNTNLSTDRAVNVARAFLRQMGQPHSREEELGTTMLDAAGAAALLRRDRPATIQGY